MYAMRMSQARLPVTRTSPRLGNSKYPLQELTCVVLLMQVRPPSKERLQLHAVGQSELSSCFENS